MENDPETTTMTEWQQVTQQSFVKDQPTVYGVEVAI